MGGGGLGETFWLLKHRKPKQASLEPGCTSRPWKSVALAYQGAEASFSPFCVSLNEFWAKEVWIKHQNGELDLFNLLPFIVPELDNETPRRGEGENGGLRETVASI